MRRHGAELTGGGGRAAPDGDPLAQTAGWPGRGAAGVATAAAGGVVGTAGPVDEPFAWASVTKLLTALAVLVACEERIVDLDDPAGPPGATLRHLLSHSSGLDSDSDGVRAAPGTRRLYSNRGIEVAAATVEASAGMPFFEYLSAAVLQPLGMEATDVTGSPASGGRGPLRDLLRLGVELLSPTVLSPGVVSPQMLAAATTVSFEGLDGVLPGFGWQSPNDWGLGFELRGGKTPHWTGRANSPSTFGHFGQSGAFVWVDPAAGMTCAAVGDQAFGPWAARAWPALSDAVVDRYGHR